MTDRNFLLGFVSGALVFALAMGWAQEARLRIGREQLYERDRGNRCRSGRARRGADTRSARSAGAGARRGTGRANHRREGEGEKMNRRIEVATVATQADLDLVLAEGNTMPILIGSAWFNVSGSAHVVARESAHVEAWGSAHVVAWGSAHVVAWESAHVEASRYVAVHQHSDVAVVVGGTVIRVPKPTTATEWCAFYGVPINGDGIVVLYKAVRDDYRSRHDFAYQPGTIVQAPDWDGGRAECGGGLHFSPYPAMAREFDDKVTRYIACPVALDDLRPPSEGDQFPAKIKARRVCRPIYEVDRAGKALG